MGRDPFCYISLIGTLLFWKKKQRNFGRRIVCAASLRFCESTSRPNRPVSYCLTDFHSFGMVTFDRVSKRIKCNNCSNCTRLILRRMGMELWVPYVHAVHFQFHFTKLTFAELPNSKISNFSSCAVWAAKWAQRNPCCRSGVTISLESCHWAIFKPTYFDVNSKDPLFISTLYYRSLFFLF